MLGKIREYINLLKNKNLKFIIVLIILAILPITVVVSQQQQEIRQRAAEPISSLPQPKEEFAPGEILVKFKTTAPSIKVKPEALSQGIDLEKKAVSLSDIEQNILPSALSTLNQKYPIKKVEKVFKETKRTETFSPQTPSGPTAPKGAELLKLKDGLSRVYKLELDLTAPIEQIIEELKEDPEVEYVEPNYIMTDQAAPNDPFYPQMWGLQKIQVENAWNITKGSNDVIVAVLDTGIDYIHEDLGGCLGENCRVIGGYDFVNDDNDPADPIDGHGTHVSGTIGAVVDNSKGISGINWDIKLMAVKVLNDKGSGKISNISTGINYAADNGAKVINMSLGGPFRCTSSQTLQDAIDYANATGAIVVVSAGNSNTDAAGFSPASCNGVIAVAATGPTDERSYYSNYGSVVDLSAPGGDITKCDDKISCLIHSTISNNQYDFYQGTSMASPHVTGAAGLLLAKFPAYSSDRIQNILIHSSDYIVNSNLKTSSGGRLNVNNALSPGDILYSPKQIQEVLKTNSSSKRSITIFNNTDSQSISWDVKFNASWLTIASQSGSIAPQSTNTLEILIDSTSLNYGTYNALLTLNTNNVQNPRITIPISLTVSPSYNFLVGRSIGGKGSDKAVGSVRDNSGNIYILGNFDNDIDFGVANLQTDNPEAFLAKYNSYGDIQWVKQIGNNKNMQFAKDIYIDEKNNVYILGNFSLAIKIDDASLEGKTSDIFIAKIHSNGNLLWLRGSPQDGKGYIPLSIASDSGDNYYISAEVSTEESLIKFNSRGDELWRKKVDKIIKDLKTKDNNLYATGGFALAKYDGNGNEIFKKENIGKFGEGNALTLDAFGNIYVVGYYDILVDPSFDPPDRDPLFLKYDSSGSLLWEKRFAGGIGSQYADSVTTDSDGNIYVAGRFNGTLTIDSQSVTNGISFTDDDIFFTVFDPSGALLFLDMLRDTNSSRNVTLAQSIHVNSHKNIYLVGNYNYNLYYQSTTVLSSSTIDDLFLVRLMPTKAFLDFHPPPNPGKAVYLNSRISYIEIYDAMNKLLMLPEFTLEAWIKPELNPYNLIEQTIFYRKPTSYVDYSAFEILSVPDEQRYPGFTNIQFMPGKQLRQLKQNIPLSKWSHIAFTRTQDKLRVFLNGEFIQAELLESSKQIPASPGASLIIGARDILPGSTNLQARVSLDDVRFSDNSRDIEGNWIKGLYQKPLEVDSNTVALWRFEGNLNDDSRNHYIATSGGIITYIEGIAPRPTAVTSSTQRSSPTQAVCTACSADVNKDGKVNSSDLTLARRCLNKSANFATGAYSCANRDMNKDGRIDIVDMNCVVRNIGKHCVR